MLNIPIIVVDQTDNDIRNVDLVYVFGYFVMSFCLIFCMTGNSSTGYGVARY